MTQGAISKSSQNPQTRTDFIHGDDVPTTPSRKSGKRKTCERRKPALKRSTHKRSHSQKTGTGALRRKVITKVLKRGHSSSVKHIKNSAKRAVGTRQTVSVTKPSCHHGKVHRRRRSGSRKGKRSCGRKGRSRRHRRSSSKKRSCKRHARKSSRKNRCLKKSAKHHRRGCHHKTRCDKGKHHCMSGKRRKTRCDKGRHHHKKCGGRGRKRAVSSKVQVKKSSLPSPGKNRAKALLRGGQ